ncbi:hypothetical protein ABT075_30665 [Streptomyces sp. NPDC002677]|uniref:hypothetical protein n=1 Tax=Streptomyces sp. NPDC002677 TaxID=3154774 RepID=UPI003319D556
MSAAKVWGGSSWLPSMSETTTLAIRVVTRSREAQPRESRSSSASWRSNCSSFCRRRVATTGQLASERRYSVYGTQSDSARH